MAETSGTTRSGRTAAVLDPGFLGGLEGLSTEEVRRRRDQAFAEREFQSYLRRLVQVRQDILTAERERRRSGGGPQSAEDIGVAERQADAVLDQTAANSPEELGDEELERSLAALTEGERSISTDRLAVMRVHDRLQEELKRRYREDPSQIPQTV